MSAPRFDEQGELQALERVDALSETREQRRLAVAAAVRWNNALRLIVEIADQPVTRCRGGAKHLRMRKVALLALEGGAS